MDRLPNGMLRVVFEATIKSRAWHRVYALESTIPFVPTVGMLVTFGKDMGDPPHIAMLVESLHWDHPSSTLYVHLEREDRADRLSHWEACFDHWGFKEDESLRENY